MYIIKFLRVREICVCLGRGKKGEKEKRRRGEKEKRRRGEEEKGRRGEEEKIFINLNYNIMSIEFKNLKINTFEDLGIWKEGMRICIKTYISNDFQSN